MNASGHRLHRLTAVLGAALAGVGSGAPSRAEAIEPVAAEGSFEAAEALPWEQVFFDPCTDNWARRWTLDGRKATLRHDAEGMSFSAGPTPGDQASHAVLWTRASFAGDVRIDYRYTRLDHATKYVNILYVQATGSGVGPHAKDLARWSELREVPWMKTYFNHMHAYHISYAAFGNDDGVDKKDYVRARRYLPLRGEGLRGTALPPDHFDTGLFAPGVPHRITVIKTRGNLWMRVRARGQAPRTFHWNTEAFPAVEEGRIGLRHMWTRSARYADFSVSVAGIRVAG